ncbi:uncharacterized protein LOC114363858 [Ostrinia furnacalis]|uniref:uncharacterized protein LOC114363858 n=1 Tax=Ostrinia furnacalis TaxID=93504 RepID=UPI001039D80D|nr:uncharacterized protein LOC114363858 [Ostrinia furnacalis]
MGNYDIIDIAYNTETEAEKEPEPSYIFDEFIEEEDINSVRWPSFVEFNKTEHNQIKTFFKATPKKTDAKVDGEKSPTISEGKPSVDGKKDNKSKDTTETQTGAGASNSNEVAQNPTNNSEQGENKEESKTTN